MKSEIPHYLSYCCFLKGLLDKLNWFTSCKERLPGLVVLKLNLKVKLNLYTAALCFVMFVFFNVQKRAEKSVMRFAVGKVSVSFSAILY